MTAQKRLCQGPRGVKDGGGGKMGIRLRFLLLLLVDLEGLDLKLGNYYRNPDQYHRRQREKKGNRRSDLLLKLVESVTAWSQVPGYALEP